MSEKRYIKFRLSLSERLMAFLFGVIPEQSLQSATDKHIVVLDKQTINSPDQIFSQNNVSTTNSSVKPIKNEIPFFDLTDDDSKVNTNF